MSLPIIPATPDWQGTPDWAMPVVEAAPDATAVDAAARAAQAAPTPPARERVTPVLISAVTPETVWPVRTTPILITPVTTTPIGQVAVAEHAPREEDIPEESVRSVEVRTPTPVTFHAVPDVGDSTRAVAEALESLAARVRRGELAIAGVVPDGDVSAAVAAALAALLGVRTTV